MTPYYQACRRRGRTNGVVVLGPGRRGGGAELGPHFIECIDSGALTEDFVQGPVSVVTSPACHGRPVPKCYHVVMKCKRNIIIQAYWLHGTLL